MRVALCFVFISVAICEDPRDWETDKPQFSMISTDLYEGYSDSKFHECEQEGYVSLGALLTS